MSSIYHFYIAKGCGMWTKLYQDLNRILALTDREPAMEGFIRVWTFVIVLQVVPLIQLFISLP